MTRRREPLPPAVRANLLGSGVGAAVFTVLAVVPFVPWTVAGAAGAVTTVVAAIFIRALIDPTFFAGQQHEPAWRDEEWAGLAVEDQRGLEALVPDDVAAALKSVSFGDVTRDDLPAADLLVQSRRAGGRS